MAVFNIRAILFVAVLWTAVHKTNNSCHALVAIRPLSSWRLSVPMPRQNHATAETQRHFRQSPRLLPLSVVPLQLSSLVVDAVTATNTVAAANTEMSPLLLYFWQTVIANGIPAAFALLVIGFTAKQFRSNSSTGRRGDSTNGDSTGSVVAAQQLYDDLYGDQDPDPFDPQRPRRRTGGFGSWLGGDNNTNKNRLPQNTGVPLSQYLQLTHVNKKYDSYQYSMTAATQTKAQAAAQYRTAAWNRAFSSSIGSSLSTTDAMNSTTTTNIATALAPSKRQELQTLEQEYLKQSALKQQEWQSLQTKLQQLAMDETMEKTLGMKSVYQLDPAAVGEKDSSTQNKTATELETSNNNIFANLGRNPSNNNKSKKKQSLLSAMSALQTSLASLETDFFQKVLVVVGPTHAAAVRTAILGRDGGFPTGAAGGVRPFFPALADESMTGRVFVTRFPGDATASQVATLREEVTALVQNGRSGVDRVVVVLQTGGGTVTGYGLAAAQLMRLKDAGLHLTIAVEQVAASGGYMMACIADRIVASPFAVLGSIGVISDIPNVYNRLKQEGIEFQTVTAGK